MSTFKMSVNYLKLNENICGCADIYIFYGDKNPNNCLIYQGIYENYFKRKEGRDGGKMLSTTKLFL